MAESCRNERKRLRLLSDSDKQSTSSKFVISEEEWLVVLGRLKDLESKRDSDSARIEELQQQLLIVKEENLRLKPASSQALKIPSSLPKRNMEKVRVE